MFNCLLSKKVFLVCVFRNDSLKNIVKVLGSDELEKLYYNLQKIKGNNKELNEG